MFSIQFKSKSLSWKRKEKRKGKEENRKIYKTFKFHQSGNYPIAKPKYIISSLLRRHVLSTHIWPRGVPYNRLYCDLIIDTMDK